MWISKKKYLQLEKRIADLEGQVQSQQPCKKGYVDKTMVLKADSLPSNTSPLNINFHLEKRIADLEEKVQSQQEKIREIEEGYQRQLNATISSMIGNLNIKERYNFELMKYLFEKFQIEEPDLEYKF